MNRFTVVWTTEAVEQLTEIWLVATDRETIVSAAESIDLELAVDPFWNSRELSEGLRSLVLPPLRIVFSINLEDRLVEVARISRGQ